MGKEFCNITGAGAQVAQQLLQVCNGNLEMAINMHMEGVDLDMAGASSSAAGASGAAGGSSSSSSASRATAAGSAKSGKPGKSNDDVDVNVEDVDEDGVRAPIPQREDRMVGPGYEGYALTRQNPNRARIRSVFDGFRNFGSEPQQSGSSRETGNGTTRTARGKKRTLEELFKPPLDIMFKGDFQDARDSATSAKKWLLINIQDAGEFQCQVLNRDVWSNKAVKTVISEHFLFWQQYKESDEAQRFLTFYPNSESEWPYVLVLDPRTGEKLVTWAKFDATSFCDLVSSFLNLQPDFNGTADNGSGAAAATEKCAATSEEPPAKRGREIIDADEDDQLAAAIRASLAESAGAGNGVPDQKNGKNGSGKSSENGEQDYSDLEFTDDESTNLSAANTPCKPSATSDSKGSPSKDKGPSSKDKGPSSKDKGLPSPVEIEKEKSSEGNQKDSESTKQSEEEVGSWEDFLGDPNDPKSSIMIRFPDGQREAKNIPCSSTFTAIIKYVTSRGFPLESYEIVTNFPRRILTDLDETKTLKELNLFPQETVFVQKR